MSTKHKKKGEKKGSQCPSARRDLLTCAKLLARTLHLSWRTIRIVEQGLNHGVHHLLIKALLVAIAAL